MFLDLKELGYEGAYERVAAFGRQWEVVGSDGEGQFCEQINRRINNDATKLIIG